MGRTHKKPITSDEPTTVIYQPDTSFDVATFERQQTAAKVVGHVADHMAMTDDTPSHAERHPPPGPRRPVRPHLPPH